jgi:flagellar protein FliO/FliZ
MNSFDIFWSFLKMISALAIILGLLIGSTYFFKRFMKDAVMSTDQGEMISVIATRYLGPKSSIMLVDIVGQVVAIGISNNQITMLTDISDPASLERLKQNRKSGGTGSPLTEQLMMYKSKWDAINPFKR